MSETERTAAGRDAQLVDALGGEDRVGGDDPQRRRGPRRRRGWRPRACRARAPGARPSRRGRSAGSGWTGSQSWVVGGGAQLGRAVQHACAATRPRVTATWSASSSRRGTTSARSSRTLSRPGTDDAAQLRRRPAAGAPSTVTSATAGPASGLTSSSTEVWPAPAPTPVNHRSGRGPGSRGPPGSCRRSGPRPGRAPVSSSPGPRPGRRRPAPSSPRPGAVGDRWSVAERRPGPRRDAARRHCASAPTSARPERGRADHGRAGQRRSRRRLGHGRRASGGRTSSERAARSAAASTAPISDRRVSTTGAPRWRTGVRAGVLMTTSSGWWAAQSTATTRIAEALEHQQHDPQPGAPGRRRRRASSGRSTCQARVVRSSALAWTSPAVASSTAATSPSAGDGQHDVLDAAVCRARRRPRASAGRPARAPGG